MNKIEVGSKVELVNAHCNCYYIYRNWVESWCPEWLPWFQSSALYNDGDTGEVVFIGQYHDKTNIYVVKTDTVIYLVREQGIASFNNFEVELL